MTAAEKQPVWFITGSSSGLGRALAERVLAHGYRLIATARRVDALSDLAAAYPEQCRTMTLDVAVPQQVSAVVEAAAAEFGRLDVIVNNAGYALAGAVEEYTDDQIARNFQTNFFGALNVIRAALPGMRARGEGHFVMLSASAAIANYPGLSVYGATKWALEGLAESLAAEVRPLGLRVTIVQPGPFRTDFVTRSFERARRSIPEYERSSGKFLQLLAGMAGRQPGDPLKAADALIAAVAAEDPPLRLVLGKYAMDKARRRLVTAARELDRNQASTPATEFSAGAAGPRRD